MKNKIYKIIELIFFMIVIVGGIVVPIALVITGDKPLYFLLYALIIFFWCILHIGIKKR